MFYKENNGKKVKVWFFFWFGWFFGWLVGFWWFSSALCFEIKMVTFEQEWHMFPQILCNQNA